MQKCLDAGLKTCKISFEKRFAVQFCEKSKTIKGSENNFYTNL